MKPVVAYLREKGVRLIIYIDDILIMAQTSSLAHQLLLLTLDLLELTGFLVYYPKCILIPSQVIEFLGFLVNSSTMTLALPGKVTKIQMEARQLLSSPLVSGRQVARMVGLLSSNIPAILPAPLHYRHLQYLKNQAVSTGSYETRVALSVEAQAELHWWTKFLGTTNGRAIKSHLTDLVIHSDASLQGWGASSNSSNIGGAWKDEECSLHINYLELLAAWYAVMAFTNGQVHHNILDRQQDHSGLHKPHGRYTLQPDVLSGSSVLALGPGEGHGNEGSTHCRQGEHSSGSHVKNSSGQIRLEAVPTDLQSDQHPVGPTGGGFVHHMSICPTRSLLQLETKAGL